MTVALLNYSVVQSLAGAAAGRYFSREWGGRVAVGSMNVNVLGNVVLHHVLLVAPDGDTIATVGRLSCSFDRFPVSSEGLRLDRVALRDAYYYLEIDENKQLNLRHIIDYFAPKEPRPPHPHHRFLVAVDHLSLRNVRYHMYLGRTRHNPHEHGVDIAEMDYTVSRARFRNVRVDADHVTCRIDAFEATERSGLHVRQLKSNIYVARNGISATNLELQTDDSRLLGDVLLRYRDWKTMSAYTDSVYMLARFDDGSYGGMRDAAYWAPVLWPVEVSATLQGLVYGTVADLHAQNLALHIGSATDLELDGDIVGLPHIDSTVVTANLYRLTTSYGDIDSLHLPFALPQAALLRKLGTVEAHASFSGSLRNFYCTADVQTQLGDVGAELLLQYDESRQDYTYIAEAQSPQLQVARLAQNEWVSHTGFSVTAQGQGLDPNTMSASAEGWLNDCVVRGRPLQAVAFSADAQDGTLSAHVHLDDDLAAFDLSAQTAMGIDSTRDYELSAHIKHLDLARFHLWREGDSTAVVATQCRLRASGNSLESLRGSAVFDNTSLQLPEAKISLRTITLNASAINHYKNVMFNSDVCHAELKGYFDYTDLRPVANRFATLYLPSYWTQHLAPTDTATLESIADAELDFSLLWTDTTRRLHYLLPSLTLAPGTALHGNYNHTESLKLVVRSDSVGYGGVRLFDMGLTSGRQGDGYGLALEADHMTVGSISLFENLRLGAQSRCDVSDLALQWHNIEAASDGDLSFQMSSDPSGNYITVLRNAFTVDSIPWHLLTQRPIVVSDSLVAATGVSIARENQAVSIDFVMRHKPDDYAQLNFLDFDLAPLDFLLSRTGIGIEGVLGGRFSLYGLGQTPYYAADLVLERTVVGGQPLGTTELKSSWNAEVNLVNVYLSTALEQSTGVASPIGASGTVDLGAESPLLDLNVHFDDLSLATVAPLASSFASRLDGRLNGDIDLSGSVAEPNVSGYAFVRDGQLNVDFLNVLFRFTDSIHLDSNRLRLDHFSLRDPRGNVATLDGTIAYDPTDVLKLDLTLHTDNFLFLNTSAGSQAFYGTVLAAADGTVGGNLHDVSVVVDARTNPGSSLGIPVSSHKQVQSLDYITFLSDSPDDEPVVVSQQATRRSATRYNLTLNVATTPDLKLSLPLDFTQMEANIKASGSGDLQLALSSESPFNIQGNYEFNDGNMSVTLIDVISKSFKIDPGSAIRFPGSVNNAMFDIRAVYSLRANMSSLTGTSSLEGTSQSVPVESVVALSGSLQDPQVGFDVRLPNADQSLQDEVFSYIDRSNDRDMLNQTMSLLLLNQFYNPSTSASETATTVANTGLSTGYSVVANSVGSVVSSMVEFVDINFDYKSANEFTTEQYEVDISKEWGRAYMEMALGYGGAVRDVKEMQGSNTLTGDILLGYKLSPRLHLIAFNRSNTNNYTKYDQPYKQGVGLKYTRDFDQWRELFVRRKKRKP